jgi:hypothetical protein
MMSSGTTSKPTVVTVDPDFARRLAAIFTADQLEVTLVSRRGVELLCKLINDGIAPAAELDRWRDMDRSDRVNAIRWVVEEDLA